MNETQTLTCPLPPGIADKILLGHGSGGRLTAQLIEKVFAPAFAALPDPLHDGAFLRVGMENLAFTTDSYVVNPLFFPGGDIGDLAVNGTVNDLAMCGAKPLYLSCAFILEEGFPLEKLLAIVKSMQLAAKTAGVTVVTGDTKVVERGKGDGLYINTAGIGVVEGQRSCPQNIQPGDLILLNGDIGRHGMAIMAQREGLSFETTIESDTRELASLTAALRHEAIAAHCMRDLTRGGLATQLVELAEAAAVPIEIDEGKVPVRPTVRGACEFLGLDPLYSACEGRMIAFTPAAESERALAVMRRFDKEACVIGQVKAEGRPLVTAKTSVGTFRLLDRLSGEQLPRIC